ncbi:MAG: hypothetical protein RMX68_019780 [Aulosira sp. ZfuVER01]|nr:hypothetical protein [Aulosira sp. ZfuVER01]MDZ7996379.1 hypothetical protein [Aulosira sp. DedVER01a]MDZ8054067.1 hypothetical protein [Aulosira sp. ZfuCHP01]
MLYTRANAAYKISDRSFYRLLLHNVKLLWAQRHTMQSTTIMSDRNIITIEPDKQGSKPCILQ